MFLRTLACALLVCMLVARVFALDSAPAFSDPQLQSRYENLTHQLRCLQCQDESIADSPVSLAADLRHEVREQLALGKTDDQIRKFMTDRYGDFVLFKPPLERRTWLLWFGPAIFLLGGLAIALRIIMQRAKLPIEPDSNEETESEHA